LPDSNDFEIRDATRDVVVAGKSVALGARAFDVLTHLDRHRDRVVTKAELLEQVWGGLAVEEGNLSVQISTLRKVLGAKAIATVPGVGYKLALSAPEAAPSRTGPDLPDIPSVAVLPFANLTGQPGQDYLVDGIVTELIGALTKISGLFTIAATSSFAYKGQSVQLSDVGRELGVRYVLEGSIQQAGAMLRISVQLVEAATGRAIWSDRFTGTLDEIFELQDRLTESVAAAIEPTLRAAEAIRSREKPESDLRAYDLCLQAEPLMRYTAKPGDFPRAFALLDEAIARDPGYALARAMRVWAYTIAVGGRFIPHADAAPVLPDAYALLEGDTTDALILAYAAHSIAFLDQAAEQALSVIQKAKALNPNSVYVLTSAGWIQAYLGQFEAALADIERALRLNPLDPNTGFARSAMGPILLGLGRVEEAVEMVERSYHEAPGYGSTVHILIHGYWMLGRLDDAKRMAAEILKINPKITVRSNLATTPFKHPPLLQMFKDAQRASGIPEG
jgi:TolB-like protein/Tfp pilus assembly protein PilF